MHVSNMRGAPWREGKLISHPQCSKPLVDSVNYIWYSSCTFCCILQCLCTFEANSCQLQMQCTIFQWWSQRWQQLEQPTFMSQPFQDEHARQSERAAAELPLQYSRYACGDQLLINHSSAVLPLSVPIRNSKTYEMRALLANLLTHCSIACRFQGFLQFSV